MACGKHVKIRPVGPVEQERDAPFAGNLRDFCGFRHAAEIVGRCYVNSAGLLRHRVNRRGDILRAQAAGGEGRAAAAEPARLEAQEGAAVDEALVRVPRREHDAARGAPRGEQEHRFYALAAPARRIEGRARREYFARVALGFLYYPLRAGEVVRARNLRDVVLLAAESAAPLVPGHMQPGDAGRGVAAHKVKYRSRQLSASSWSMAWSHMAHSMRFLKSSQPYSYTPLTLPVAW